jgi:hypothetical protein
VHGDWSYFVQGTPQLASKVGVAFQVLLWTAMLIFFPRQISADCVAATAAPTPHSLVGPTSVRFRFAATLV